MTTPTPTTYRLDSYGRQVPLDRIAPIDLLRDDTVKAIVTNATALQKEMQAWKHQVLADITAFCQISAEQYGVKWGGKKGNISLVSYDGKYKVILAVSDNLAFDERLQVAKTLVDECIHEWTQDSNSEIKVLVEHAFQTDREGKINTGRIFSLMRVKIEHPKWLKAMDALRDSIKAESTSQYLRLYERVGESDKYKQISMDIAGL
jgi:hypothetical protein